MSGTKPIRLFYRRPKKPLILLVLRLAPIYTTSSRLPDSIRRPSPNIPITHFIPPSAHLGKRPKSPSSRNLDSDKIPQHGQAADDENRKMKEEELQDDNADKQEESNKGGKANEERGPEAHVVAALINQR